MNCAETVGVRTFLNFECGCGPHCAVRTAHHSTGGLEAYSIIVEPHLKGAITYLLHPDPNQQKSRDVIR